MKPWQGFALAAALGIVPARAQPLAAEAEASVLLAIASDRSIPFEKAKGPPALYLNFPDGGLLTGVVPGQIALVQPARLNELPKGAPVLQLIPDPASRTAKGSSAAQWRFKDVCGGFWRGEASAEGGSLRLSPFAAAYVVRGPLTPNPDCALLRNPQELAIFLKQNGYALANGEPLTQERVFTELTRTETLEDARESRREQTVIMEFNPIKLQLEQQERNARDLPSPAMQDLPPPIPEVP